MPLQEAAFCQLPSQHRMEETKCLSQPGVPAVTQEAMKIHSSAIRSSGRKAPTMCSRHHDDKFIWLNLLKTNTGCRDFCVCGTDGDYSLSWQVVSLTEHLKGGSFLFCLKEGILEARG